jgi:hypothetical protein
MKRKKESSARPPLALPHERDESTQAPGARRAVIKQAARDLAAGLVDTDNYTRAATIAAPGKKRGARRP